VLQALAVSACILFFGLKSIAVLAGASILASCLISILISLKISKLPLFKESENHSLPHWKKTLSSIFSMGAFTSAASMMTGLSLIFLSVTAAQYGADALGAYGLVVRLEVIMMLLTTSVGVAVVTTCASSLGRNDVHKAISAAKIGVALTTMIVGAVGILVALGPDIFLHPFNTTSGVRESAIMYLSIVGWAFPFMAIGFSSFFVGQGINRPKLFFGAAAFRLIYLVATVHFAVVSFKSFSIAVASAYCIFSMLAVMALLYESGKLKKKTNEAPL
jgi:Na+-driven multidrug efflux pump